MKEHRSKRTAPHHGPADHPVRGAHHIPAKVLADRNQREAAAKARTATQSFFGDPPPGFSALDQRGKG